MIKNNAFTLDGEAQCLERLGILSNGIDRYGEELGFSNDEITIIKDSTDKFFKGLDNLHEESAENAEIYTRLHLNDKEARKQLAKCRGLIHGEMCMADESLKKYLEERVEVRGRVPNRRMDFIEMVRNMLDVYDALPVEKPDIVFPPQPFEKLRTLFDSILITLEKISRERAESREARAKKVEIRKECNLMLSRIYHRAVSFWGNNDSRLLELGMLPKSQVWTPKKKKEAAEDTEKKPVIGYRLSENCDILCLREHPKEFGRSFESKPAEK